MLYKNLKLKTLSHNTAMPSILKKSYCSKFKSFYKKSLNLVEKKKQ